MEKNYSKQLTVVITTYNRKQPLIEQLQSLERQGRFDDYSIIISNNCSDYDVDVWLDEQLSPEFRKIVSIYNRKYNVGGDINIAFTFQLVDTPWMWLLSDDDITEPDALDTIFHDMEAHKDVCYIKYSIAGNFKPLADKKISQLEEYFDYFSKDGHSAGEMIFMSNQIYNLTLLQKYIGEIPRYQTSMTQCMPAFMAMRFDGMDVLLSSKCVCNFTPGRPSYSSYKAWSSFGNLLYSSLDMTPKQVKAFKKILFMPHLGIVQLLMRLDNKALRTEYFKKMFVAHYSYFSFRGMALLCIFYFFHYTNLNPNSVRKLFGKKPL